MNCVLLLLPLLAVACCHSTDETLGNDRDMGSTMTHRGGRYQYVSKQMTFLDAELHCKSLGEQGHLACIHSKEINDLILQLGESSGGPVWIGGHRLLKSEHFIWIDGSSWNYNNWAPGEPNFVGGAEECTEMYTSQQRAGSWNDISCSVTRSFICEY
ncbi:lectin-like [Protopterus annectens]|uniref:lectin-like n=1 Tax=Protopterus annectens TaxID=7888 RepID=UPI001CF9FD53|nr:lectin-like [Protopterus annectens]